MTQPSNNSKALLSRRQYLGGLGLLSVALVLGACGWRVRGKIELPYKKILLSGTVTPELKNSILMVLNINDIQVVNTAKESDLVLEIMSEQNAKQVLSYNASGQITSYRIISRIVFRTFDPATGLEIMPESDIYQMRDLEFNQSNIQAFDQMVNDYVNNMRSDLVIQLMRRLASIKKLPTDSSGTKSAPFAK